MNFSEISYSCPVNGSQSSKGHSDSSKKTEKVNNLDKINNLWNNNNLSNAAPAQAEKIDQKQREIVWVYGDTKGYNNYRGCLVCIPIEELDPETRYSWVESKESIKYIGVSVEEGIYYLVARVDFFSENRVSLIQSLQEAHGQRIKCKFDDQEIFISQLTARILLGKKIDEELPESLDFPNISFGYVRFLLKFLTIFELSNRLGGRLENLDDNLQKFELKNMTYDERHIVLEFLDCLLKDDRYVMIRNCRWLTQLKDFGTDDTITFSACCRELSSSRFKNLAKAALASSSFKSVKILGSEPNQNVNLKRSCLEAIANDPSFDTELFFKTDCEIVLNEGATYKAPLDFYYEMKWQSWKPSEWSVAKPHGHPIFPVPLQTVQDTIKLYLTGNPSFLNFVRAEAVILFLQDFCSDSTWAETTIINFCKTIKTIPLGNLSSWNDVRQWLEPYSNLQSIYIQGQLCRALIFSEIAKKELYPIDFINKEFYFSINDGDSIVQEVVGFVFFIEYQRYFEIDYDKSTTTDEYASKECPLIFKGDKKMFDSFKVFLRAMSSCLRETFTVDDLLAIQPFWDKYNDNYFLFTRDHIATRKVKEYLENTTEATVKVDWSAENPWESVSKQLDAVPKAQEIRIEGIPDLWHIRWVRAFASKGAAIQKNDFFSFIPYQIYKQPDQVSHALLKALILDEGWDEVQQNETMLSVIKDIPAASQFSLGTNLEKRSWQCSELIHKYGTNSLKEFLKERIAGWFDGYASQESRNPEIVYNVNTKPAWKARRWIAISLFAITALSLITLIKKGGLSGRCFSRLFRQRSPSC